MLTLQERMAEVFPQPQPRGLQSEIASLCIVKPASVSAWFNRPEKVSSISRANAEKICERFGLKVAPAWLAEGIGDKYQETTLNSVKGNARLSGVQAKPSAGDMSIANTLDNLADKLNQLEPTTRIAAGGLLTALAQQPDNPALLAALTALLTPAAFAQKEEKAA